MLEIILIIFLCKKMGSVLNDKGWEKTFWMQLLVVLVYLASLFFGSIAYAIFVIVTQGQEAADQLGLSLYLAAYVGAAIGVGGLFLATKLIQPKEPISEPPPLV